MDGENRGVVMNCRDCRDVANSFLGDELLTETNHEILQHLDTCPSCRAEIAARRQIRGSLRDAFDRAPDLQPPPDFSERLRERIRVAGADAGLDRPLSRRWLMLAASVLLSAGLAGAVFVTQLMTPVDALARDAIGDHVNCALKNLRVGTPVSLEEAAQRFDPVSLLDCHRLAAGLMVMASVPDVMRIRKPYRASSISGTRPIFCRSWERPSFSARVRCLCRVFHD
jgi:anti-sigma factor RsiW